MIAVIFIGSILTLVSLVEEISNMNLSDDSNILSEMMVISTVVVLVSVNSMD